jgi:hypothetical protein
MLRIPLLLAGLALSAGTDALSQPAASYTVGFRLVHELDHSRTVGPARDFEGRVQSTETAVPMPIGIWYPATAARNAVRMSVGDYHLLSMGRESPRPFTDADRTSARDEIKRFAQFVLNREISDADAAAVYSRPLSAIRDAPPLARRFPVIIAGPDGSLGGNAKLLESLASRGYVVVVTPARRAMAAIETTRPALALDTRIRDLEYATDFARRQPNADMTKLGILGINFDGMTALLYQMKNMRAIAVASIDGWEGKQGMFPSIRASTHFDPARFRVPYFVVQQDEANAPPSLSHDFTVFDALKYGTGEHLVIRGLSHAFLVGTGALYDGITDEQRTGHAFLTDRVGAFFDAAVKGTPLAVVAESPLAKTSRRHAALPPIPYGEEIERIAMAEGGAERLRQIYRAARAVDSTTAMISRQQLNLFAFRMARSQRMPDAILLYELGTEAFPRSTAAHNDLGNTYMQAADTVRAVRAFERALAVLDTDPEIAESERAQSRNVIQTKVNRLRPRP